MPRVDRDIHGEVGAPRDWDATIVAIAARQHGVVARRQLRAAGVPVWAIDARLGARRLHPLHRGVYAVGHPGVSPPARDLAAVLACGAGAVLSHQSAGARYGLVREWRGDVHVTRRHDGDMDGIVIHSARSLTARDRSRHFGIPITSPARTLLDLADVLSAAELERAIAEAQVRHLVTPAALAEQRPGRRRIVPAPPTRSELEREFLRFVERNSLPRPVVNERVEGFEVDAHWPDARLVVELDSYEFHAHRRAFEEDRRRDAVLQAAGWRSVRLTHRSMRDPRTAALVSRLAREPARSPA